MIIPYERYEYFIQSLEHFLLVVERYQFIYDHIEINGSYDFDTLQEYAFSVYRIDIDRYLISSLKDHNRKSYDFDILQEDAFHVHRIDNDCYLFSSLKDHNRKSYIYANFVNMLWIKENGIKKHQLNYKKTMKYMAHSFRNYPKLNIEELCQESFKPSRVMYSINCDPEWDN